MADHVNAAAEGHAMLRLRVAPWRPRRRQIPSSLIREHADEILNFSDDFASFLVTVGVWLTLLVAAPVIVVVLAILFLPIEITLAVIVAVGVLAFRFTGLMRWTVLLSDGSGIETAESYRNIVRAARRIQAVNNSSKVALSFVW